jgi:hypothetical protein
MKKKTKNTQLRSREARREKAKTITTRSKQQKFEPHILAIVLVGFLLLEGCLITTTNSMDWQSGLAVLDVSAAVTQTSSDIAVILEPVTDVMSNVHQFYTLAAIEMSQILDFSDANPIADLSLLTDGVNDFYQQAATQMAQLLEISPQVHSTSGNVAGASVIRYR